LEVYDFVCAMHVMLGPAGRAFETRLQRMKRWRSETSRL
jgi:hypothetical protein